MGVHCNTRRASLVRRSPELRAGELPSETPLSVGANDKIPVTSTGLISVGFHVKQVYDLQKGYSSGWAAVTFGLFAALIVGLTILVLCNNLQQVTDRYLIVGTGCGESKAIARKDLTSKRWV